MEFTDSGHALHVGDGPGHSQDPRHASDAQIELLDGALQQPDARSRCGLTVLTQGRAIQFAIQYGLSFQLATARVYDAGSDNLARFGRDVIDRDITPRHRRQIHQEIEAIE